MGHGALKSGQNLVDGSRLDMSEQPLQKSSCPASLACGPVRSTSGPCTAADFRFEGLSRVTWHFPHLQRKFQVSKVPYGIQYEIARLASTTKTSLDVLSDHLEVLKDVKTNSDGIVRVKEIFHGYSNSPLFSREAETKSPWLELDLENSNRAKDELSGCGFSPVAQSGWFGGKIKFAGIAYFHPENKSELLFHLHAPELEHSDRVRRRWGSSNLLTLTFPNEVHYRPSDIDRYVKRPFILLGGVFRAFDVKDSRLFLVRTNEFVEGNRIHPTRFHPDLPSLSRFLAWQNPIESNRSQVRETFALGRSNSAPALRLDIECIEMIPDICMSLCPGFCFFFLSESRSIDSESGSVMTDGAGLVNKAALHMMYNNLEMETWPTAVQCRVKGAKGLLVLHPTDSDDKPRIWLRTSQVKIQHCDDCSDPSFRTIDLLRSSHTKANCRLPVETIINLSENGVPSSVFVDLLEQTLAGTLEPLTCWEGPMAMERLWCAVAHIGGVISSRLARQDTILARVKGYSERGNEATDISTEEEEIPAQSQSIAWWEDEISGCPSSLEETVMALLDSGFCPKTCNILRYKLRMIIDGYINRYLHSYRLELPPGFSAMAFLVPDELDVLGTGEFFFRSSGRDLQTIEGQPTDTLLGYALITRHPCKLPTDVQKWKAVDVPALRHLTDVIVCSTRGTRRAADYLSGGDYDGDKGLLIWHPSLVEPFTNAPTGYSEEPPSVSAGFLTENETVEEFLERTKLASEEEKISNMQDYLLGGLSGSPVVGKYSNWHLNAVYSLGYTHPETIRLAYMFCKTLDGAKTGLKVKPTTYSEDVRAYDWRPPMVRHSHWCRWKEHEESKSSRDTTNLPPLHRPESLPPFIMDQLFQHVTSSNWRITLAQKIENSFDIRHTEDRDLIAPWRSTMLIIKCHVKEMYEEHRTKVARGKDQFTNLPIEQRQDILRELSRKFADGPADLDEAARLKASYAYIYDLETQKPRTSNPWSRFPWDVAFREVEHIDLHIVPFKPLSSTFYERFRLKVPRMQ
ncbi:RNA dependent RNA polymerase-domain-containing protein [Mycena polygramma]|nr:RNA dependent RNA polymerase-domain-containing protein [Mycena polygramma]